MDRADTDGYRVDGAQFPNRQAGRESAPCLWPAPGRPDRRPGPADGSGALIILFGLLSHNFWTFRTLQSVVNQVPDLLVVAVAMTLVLIGGGIDLSVGSVLALSGTVLGMAMIDWGWPLVLAVAACLAVGATCGLLNGLVSVLWSIPSFIVTLGMLEVARGAAYLVTDSQTKYIGPRIERVAQPLTGLTRIFHPPFG